MYFTPLMLLERYLSGGSLVQKKRVAAQGLVPAPILIHQLLFLKVLEDFGM